VKANAYGATVGIVDLAGGASIQNDVLHWIWFALRRKATPLFDMFDAPRRSEHTRGVLIQSARRIAEKRQKVQISIPYQKIMPAFCALSTTVPMVRKTEK